MAISSWSESFLENQTGFLTCRYQGRYWSDSATIGLVNARYLWESGAHSTFQGGTFLIGFTIARPKTN